MSMTEKAEKLTRSMAKYILEAHKKLGRRLTSQETLQYAMMYFAEHGEQMQKDFTIMQMFELATNEKFAEDIQKIIREEMNVGE